MYYLSIWVHYVYVNMDNICKVLWICINIMYLFSSMYIEWLLVSIDWTCMTLSLWTRVANLPCVCVFFSINKRKNTNCVRLSRLFYFHLWTLQNGLHVRVVHIRWMCVIFLHIIITQVCISIRRQRGTVHWVAQHHVDGRLWRGQRHVDGHLRVTFVIHEGSN